MRAAAASGLRAPPVRAFVVYNSNPAAVAPDLGQVRRGLMRHEQREFLGLFRSNRYYPDHNARQALIGELRAVASGQQPLDNRLALLAALVHTSGLSWALKFSSAERKRLKKISAGEELGNAVEAAVADLNEVLTPPRRSRHRIAAWIEQP